MMSFFERSLYLDREVLRLLSHAKPNWELIWNPADGKFLEEEESFAKPLNDLIHELELADPPPKYHDHEDRLAEYTRERLGWDIRKENGRWVGNNYESILEQGGFEDLDEHDLVLAAAGRIRAAIDRGQNHFDEMDDSHRRMLGFVLGIILYHRTPPDDPAA